MHAVERKREYNACNVAADDAIGRREDQVSWMGVGQEVIAGKSGAKLVATRTVVLASADAGWRQRLRTSLTGQRWQVREARGGVEAMAHLEASTPEAILVDSWLPDLEVGEFAGQIRMMYPLMELLQVDGRVEGGARSPRRNELLHAMREAQNAPANDTAVWAVAPVSVPRVSTPNGVETPETQRVYETTARGDSSALLGREEPTAREHAVQAAPKGFAVLPELAGASEPMRELARLIQLVAPRSTTVLIEGETGTGKEVVAKALHRLSARSGKPFVVLNCAAIPEALLEAELFGHTRGAFTGAVQSRTGLD